MIQGSLFAAKVANLPQHIKQKAPYVFRSAFDGIIERSLPAVEAEAIYEEFRKQANNGSQEAQAFVAAVVEAKAYTEVKILPPSFDHWARDEQMAWLKKLQCSS